MGRGLFLFNLEDFFFRRMMKSQVICEYREQTTINSCVFAQNFVRDSRCAKGIVRIGMGVPRFPIRGGRANSKDYSQNVSKIDLYTQRHKQITESRIESKSAIRF